ncbi:MAG: DinB family protein [Chloroflexota bacterium]
MNAAAIRVLFDYNAWANAQVWSLMQTISDEKFTREVDYSQGSLRNHLVHMASVDARWFARVCGTRLPDKLQPETFKSREDVSRLWSVIYSDIDLVLQNLQDARVMQVIEYEARGEKRASEAWKILLHVINHSTDHRAQILYLLHKLGVKTVEQDFVYYLRDELPPRGQVTVSADIIRQLFSYDIYMTSQLVADGMAGLNDGQLDRDSGYAHGNVRAQLAHILVAGRYWLERAFDVEIDGSVNAIFRAMSEHGDGVTDSELMMPVEYKTGAGVSAANMRWEMLWNLVNHGTDHRAQTLAMLYELGAPTFEQDLMIYFWEVDDRST